MGTVDPTITALTRVDMNGNTFLIEPEVLRMEERMVIHLYPHIHYIVDPRTGNRVWTRTIAYFPGDYNPGSKTVK